MILLSDSNKRSMHVWYFLLHTHSDYQSLMVCTHMEEYLLVFETHADRNVNTLFANKLHLKAFVIYRFFRL